MSQPDPTLPLRAEIASLRSTLASVQDAYTKVQDAYTKASLELLAMQRAHRVEPDDETAMRQPDSDETRWEQLEVD